ncbi:MAG: tail fiber protein [Hydrogenophaga sp.]|uniref:tail fiber protein n=1 Tax=Hydrogenophaga sp. TaxID=1904254 RepID=UPI004036D13B
MPITALPTPPTRQDPDNFSQRGDEFLGALPTFVTQANDLATQVNSSETNVVAMAALVLPASSAALAAANYVGIWSSLSGSLAIPASVYHAGRFWMLLTSLGNVATSQPGVSSDWAPVSDDVGLVGHFPFNAAPTGWLKANGAAVSRTAYAALYARAVANGAFAANSGDWAANPGKFYVGNGSTTFNLPDLRGDHIRALDDGKGIDASRGLGTLQLSQTMAHTHTGTTSTQNANHTHSGTTNSDGTHQHGSISGRFAVEQAGASLGLGGTGSVGYDSLTGAGGTHSHSFTSGIESANHAHSFTTGSTGGAEARVRNTALLACIKF